MHQVAGRPIVFMTIEAIGYFSIILLIESSIFNQFMHDIHKYRNNLMKITEYSNHDNIDVDIEQERLNIDHYKQLLTNPALIISVDKNEEDSNEIEKEIEMMDANKLEREGLDEEKEMSTRTESDKNINEYVLIMDSIRKTYLPSLISSVGNVKHALRGITFGIKRGERFGLLGING